jgi:hypothetical protein
MADMHLLGDVRAGVIDDDDLRVLGLLNAELGVLAHFLELLRQPRRIQAHVDESGSGDGDFARHLAEVELRLDLLGHRTRVRLHLLGQPHRGVGLVVAELFVLARNDHRIGINAERIGDGLAERGVELVGDRAHGKQMTDVMGPIAFGRARQRRSCN